MVRMEPLLEVNLMSYHKFQLTVVILGEEGFLKVNVRFEHIYTRKLRH